MFCCVHTQAPLRERTALVPFPHILGAWQRDFYYQSSMQWCYQDADTVSSHFEGEWLEQGVGTTKKLNRRASVQTMRASTKWRASSPHGISLEAFVDMDEWLDVLCALIPHASMRQPSSTARRQHQPTCRCRDCIASKKAARVARRGGSAKRATDADDYGSSADSEDSAEEDDDEAQLPTVVAAEPMKEVTVTVKDTRGFVMARTLTCAIGTDCHATADNITRVLPEGTRLHSTSCGYSFFHGVPSATSSAPAVLTREAAKAVHAWISEEVSHVFDAATRALASGDYTSARTMARSVIDNRPASGARDMSQSFSNVALQLSIDAVGLLVDAVHIVNSAPASQQGIARALRLMMDASTACMECLSGADTTNTPHLVATREHSMGQTLIENMTVMTRVIADTTQMVKSMCAVNRAISFDD